MRVSNSMLIISIITLISYLFYPLPETNTSIAGIEDSHHDFGSASWSNGEICRPCHIPHNANTDVQDSPLWNHELSVATYNVYSSSTLNSFPGQPSGKSKLCLSCHDGTVALENHSGNTGGTRYIGVGNVGTNLMDDHPISFIYDADLASRDGQLNDPTSTITSLGGTIAEDLLDNGRNLECSSCHDVHVARNTQGCSGCHFVHGQTTRTLSIRIDNAGSALCLTCHKK